MRSLVHRRHSMREGREDHLSREGLELARRVGRASGAFDRVVTSPRVRAIETAEAMGFVVDARLEELGSLPPSIARRVDGGGLVTFGEFVHLAGAYPEVRDVAERLAAAWGREIARVREGGRVLMISHAGILELGVVGAVGDRAANWGESLAPLEGVRLDWEQGRWVDAEVLRHRS
jgi:broad specificity phosphatase PhoE